MTENGLLVGPVDRRSRRTRRHGERGEIRRLRALGAAAHCLLGSLMLASLSSPWIVAAPLPAESEPGDPTMSEQLAEAIVSVRFEDLSPQVLERTRLAVLDNLATLAFTSRLEDVDSYIERLRERGGKEEATVWGRGFRLPMEDAAAANAFLIHAAETDDSDFRASLRASPVVMAPALVMAEASRASGREFLLTVAIGYTVLGRVAEPLGPLQGMGLMSSGVWGPTSSAAIAARLLGLDAERTAWALGLAVGSGGGSFQYFYDQTEEKRLVVARAARNGVEAALQARRGFEGPRHVFEGTAGVYRIFSFGRDVDIDPARLARDFSSLEGPLHLYPKFFSASASIIPTLEALDPLYRELAPEPSEIDHFVVRAEPGWARVLQEKVEHFEPPSTTIGAKINFSFVVALFLLRGSAGVWDFDEEALANPEILALAERARFEPLAPGEGLALELVLRDGQRYVVEPRRSDGTEVEPLARDLRERKVAELTREALDDDGRRRLRQLVEELPSVADMADWTAEVNRLITAPRFRP